MIITIDIGNTNIVLGGFSDTNLLFTARIATNPLITEDEYATKIQGVLDLRHANGNVEGVIISSVVPPLNTIMTRAIQMVYGIKPLLVQPGIKTGVNLLCDNPATVGSDLICACVAAKYLYCAPALIVDIGTATKIIATDKTGAMIGVSIIPGVEIGLKALATYTAQLPQISLEAPPSVLGKNTIDCMRSGVVFGNAAMLDGMIDRFCEERKEELPIIATGGLASTIIPHCKHNITLDPDLVLKGLCHIYRKNSNESGKTL
ncbi:MAG: type III pantothenate kinase [Ruminococcaceae bacterium]|nr:type III pantothenate kinase [Oscillospiraceae bacterium]